MSKLTITDQRLKPVADKVLAGVRLSEQDGIALYRSPDLLAVGWLANHVREKRHGNVTYFNVKQVDHQRTGASPLTKVSGRLETLRGPAAWRQADRLSRWQNAAVDPVERARKWRLHWRTPRADGLGNQAHSEKGESPGKEKTEEGSDWRNG
jgi:hypothetical protein